MANFSPASETNPLKIVDYMKRSSARAENPRSVLQTELGFSARPNGPENLKNFHVIETEFEPGLKSRKQYGCHWEVEEMSVELKR